MNPLILLELAGRITDTLVRSPSVPVAPADKPAVREAVAEAIVKDPVIINELNGEAPVQSRVLWGNTIAGIGASIIAALPVLVLLGWLTQEQADLIRDNLGAVVEGLAGAAVIGGVVYSTYGRLASGLRPLFSKKA